jgi:hypothetical protein
MKKLIYILVVSVAAAMTITSCTEEKIDPRPSYNGGGGASERPR